MFIISSESEERGHWEGVGVCVTLLQSDTVQPYGYTKKRHETWGVGLDRKPKDLSASESVTLPQSDTAHPYFFTICRGGLKSLFIVFIMNRYLLLLLLSDSLIREVETKPTNECRCDERLKTLFLMNR